MNMYDHTCNIKLTKAFSNNENKIHSDLIVIFISIVKSFSNLVESQYKIRIKSLNSRL